jgi:hypothetical protein
VTLPLPTGDAFAYAIELTPRAWKQVGSVSAGAFAQIRNVLGGVARSSANAVREGAAALFSPEDERAVAAGDYRVVYTRDDRRRVIFVHTIVQDVEEPT